MDFLDEEEEVRPADQTQFDQLIRHDDDGRVPMKDDFETDQEYETRLENYANSTGIPIDQVRQLVDSMWEEVRERRTEEAVYNESKQMAEEREMEQHNARFELLDSFESAFNTIKGSIRKAIEAIQTGRYANSPEEKNILTLLTTISNKNLSDSKDISIDQTEMSALVQKSFKGQNPCKQLLSQSDIDNINDLKSTLDAYNMLISEGQLYGGKTKRRSRKTKKAGKRKHARRRGTRKW